MKKKCENLQITKPRFLLCLSQFCNTELRGCKGDDGVVPQINNNKKRNEKENRQTSTVAI